MAQLSWNMSMLVVMVVLICSFETKKSEAVPAVCTNCKMYNLQLHEILVPTKELAGDTPSQNILYNLLRRILTGKQTEPYNNVTEGPDGAETNSTESPIPDVINIPVLVEQSKLPAPSSTVPVLIQTIVGNSSIINDKTSSGGLSIQISTSINIGGNFNQGSQSSQQGSIVGPLVLSTSIQLNNDVQPKINNCADCYNSNYNDDEDYYHDQSESSGDQEYNITMTTDSSDDSSNSTTVRDSNIEI